MNDLEKMIMEEISTLDELRLIDILGFIRYLKAEKPIKQDWIVGWFDNAIQSIQERKEELQIRPEDIESQIDKRNRKID
ncbi:MAG TPA: hypothetical protein PK078_10225 [Anaerolineales bacterium]|nr:hypothetical protein [Anaerolineales bacterium]HNA87813.1 hypothetical protein [Anaerolineales bacterium]HNB34893.1 hypothetical protein [Anaerolineales bacterium]HNC07154.1 hypothetical protein [Anaerolineales bacterium]